ncbi:hypothetical protein ACFQFH_19955 [Halobaculum halobium]|uniref:Ribbon-helix-helix protein, copG family n=1 Tax=Halobaculum halobium TaxID=3032281 RepID=A0ABD5TLB1_9EURY|nr:hypothetical protein [Halobaculum sp. SYNS20]
MSATSDGGDETHNVTTTVSSEFKDDFDRALKKAQIEGHVPLNMSRSEAIRNLMQAAIADPSLMAGPEDDGGE